MLCAERRVSTVQCSALCMRCAIYSRRALRCIAWVYFRVRRRRACEHGREQGVIFIWMPYRVHRVRFGFIMRGGGATRLCEGLCTNSPNVNRSIRRRPRVCVCWHVAVCVDANFGSDHTPAGSRRTPGTHLPGTNHLQCLKLGSQNRYLLHIGAWVKNVLKLPIEILSNLIKHFCWENG